MRMNYQTFSLDGAAPTGLNLCDNSFEQVAIHTTYTVALGMLFLVYSCKWFRSRKFFPIRERSPFLTLLFALSGLFNMLAYPVARIYCYTYTCDNQNSRILASFVATFQILAFLPYLFRLIRIYVVFEMRLNSKFLMFVNRGEKVWILLTLSIFAALISWILTLNPAKGISGLWVYYLNDKGYSKSIVPPIVYSIESFTLLLFAFLLRKIPPEYSFYRELVTLLIVNLIFSNALELMALSDLSDSLQCLGPIPLFHIIINLKFLVIFIVTIINPIMVAIPDHLNLSPLLVLEGELNFVLKDEKCFIPFYKFAEHKENTEVRTVGSMVGSFLQPSRKNSKPPLYPLSLLSFVMRVTLIEKHEKLKSDALRRLVDDCVISSNKELFQSRIKKQLGALYSDPNYDFKIEDIAEAYTQAYQDLNNLYLTEYRFTNSFNFLKRNLEANEEICRRLNIYKMI